MQTSLATFPSGCTSLWASAYSAVCLLSSSAQCICLHSYRCRHVRNPYQYVLHPQRAAQCRKRETSPILARAERFPSEHPTDARNRPALNHDIAPQWEWKPAGNTLQQGGCNLRGFTNADACTAKQVERSATPVFRRRVRRERGEHHDSTGRQEGPQ